VKQEAGEAVHAPSMAPSSPPSAHHQLGAGLVIAVKKEEVKTERSAVISPAIGLRLSGGVLGRTYDDDPIAEKPRMALPVDSAETDASLGAKEPVLNDLSEYAQHAIKALAKRNADKKLLSTASKSHKPKVKTEMTAVRPKHRLRCKVKPEHVVVKTEARVVKKEQGIKRRRADTSYTQAPKKMPPCPADGLDGETMDYKGGRIYWKTNSTAFRVIRVRGNYGTEKKIRWAKWRPVPTEWQRALSAIDEYVPKEK
jgi:hypothetical protein